MKYRTEALSSMVLVTGENFRFNDDRTETDLYLQKILINWHQATGGRVSIEGFVQKNGNGVINLKLGELNGDGNYAVRVLRDSLERMGYRSSLNDFRLDLKYDPDLASRHD